MTLRYLWSAPAMKSAAVASAATGLLTHLLRMPACPPRVPISLLDAIGNECSSLLSMGLAQLLATLAPIYATLPRGIRNRMPLLLWHLLSLPPSAAARESINPLGSWTASFGVGGVLVRLHQLIAR